MITGGARLLASSARKDMNRQLELDVKVLPLQCRLHVFSSPSNRLRVHRTIRLLGQAAGSPLRFPLSALPMPPQEATERFPVK